MWTYNGQPVTELPTGTVGFVYKITNTTNNRGYIGKKLSKFSRTKYRMVTLKNGTKKRKRIKSEIDSDWLTYYGSSPALSADIEQLGADKFTREILYYCKSKGECSYIESRTQFQYRVLESDDWYNGNIMCRIHKNHIKGKL